MSATTRSVKPALPQLNPIVVEIHVCRFSSINTDGAAVSNNVVAAGDGGEDARLDVHRTLGTCVNIVCE